VRGTLALLPLVGVGAACDSEFGEAMDGSGREGWRDVTTRTVGYVELLRTHGTFRRFFIANCTSLIGTWFTTIALFVLAGRISDAPDVTVGLVMVLQMVALALPQPFTGMLADRFSRKALMVGAEALSALVVLALVFVDGPADAWLYYGAVVALMVLHAVYLPAESAALPRIVEDDEALLTANALNSASWSTALAIGAALGGAVVAAYGTDVAFVIDAATFVFSAVMLARLDIPQQRATPSSPSSSLWRDGVTLVVEGVRIIRAHPPVLRVLSAKALWAVFGGGLIYTLVLLGDEVGFGEVAAGVGVLYAVRGAGSGVGPVVARMVLRDRRRWPLFLGVLVSLSGLAYLVVALAPFTPWLVVPVFCSHAASGANWVLSTVMLQQRTEDAWRGRVFAADYLLVTAVLGLSTLGAAWWRGRGDLDLRVLIGVLAAGQVLSGLFWVAITWPAERRLAAAAARPASPS
jgi:MFS family permease